ncbi:MAG TPA: outer-membrane lipoprotein carrier protein LolA [Candidatus Acidoferrales bacterium]|nr:outer-membrane lipoprotein carrier protein LolA [Candidatus Acidoferrales bacterium]
MRLARRWKKLKLRIEVAKGAWSRELLLVVLVLGWPAVWSSAHPGARRPEPPGQNSTPWTLDAVLRQLDIEAKRFRSLTADLERTKVTVVVNDRSTESGQIYVRHDGKMRIDLTQPDPRTILRDGNELYLFNPRIRQVELYDLSEHRSLVDQFLLLGFGTSGAELKKSYLITLLGQDTLDKQKVILLELTPRSDEVRNQVSKIQLWVDESTWLSAQQKFFETGSGDYFIIRYTNVVRNVKISDSRFKPHWPKGTAKVKRQG